MVGPDNKASVRSVKTGDRVGANWIISEGLKPGDRVIVEGIQKVQTFAAQSPEMAKQGVPVTVKPYTGATGGAD